MKKKSTSKSACFNVRVLIASVVALVGVFIALLGFGASSNASIQASAAPKAQQFGQTTVISPVRSDLSPPLRNQPLVWPATKPEHEANPNPKLPYHHQDGLDPVIQSSFWQQLIGIPAIPSPILQWGGISYPGVNCNCTPPDTNGEVGKTQYVQMVNEGVWVFDKLTGTPAFGPVSISSIWSGFGGACQNGGTGDPVVIYDQLADRWIISQMAIPTGASAPQNECIAVSQTGDATGAWYRYDFHLTSNSIDYQKLGVWPDGYYMAANIFDSSGFRSYLGPQPFVFDRVKLLVGDPAATAQTPGIIGNWKERIFLPGDLDGIIPPPAGDPNHYVAFPQGQHLSYKIWAYHVDFANPANSAFTLEASVGAASFTSLCPTGPNCVPQAGTSTKLDVFGDRLMFRNAYRRFSDGHESILNNYNVSANSVAGIRWFELRRTQPGNWSIFQESTYQPDATWRWMSSIASDNQGNIAVGFSASSESINPQIRYAGRLTTDPLNVLSGEQHLFDGTGSLGDDRWGDYSDLTVDPVDDCTFYYTSEYAASSFDWRTRIGYFRFAECTVPQKGTAHFVVTACTGGAPVSDASASIDSRPYGATLSNGTYDAVLSPGSHSYSVSKTGVGSQAGNFTISNGQTTNLNVCFVNVPTPTPTPTGGWIIEPSMSYARRYAATAVVGSYLYAITGTTGYNPGPIYSPVNERFDGVTWTSMAPIPVPIEFARGAAVGSNIYVPGGRNANGTLDLMQIYNTVTDAWSNGMNLPAPRASGAIVAFNGLVYVIAGSDSNDVFVYDPVSNTYSNGAPMPAVANHVAGVLLNGEIYVVGGGLPGTAPVAHYSYNPTTNSWRTIASMPTADGLCPASGGFVLDNELWIVGCAGQPPISEQVWIYNPGSDMWRLGPQYNVDHQGPGAALFNERGFVVGGGHYGGGSTAVESIGSANATPTPTPTATPTATPSPTPTATATATATATPTATATATAAATATATPTATATATATATPTATATATATATPTATVAPTPAAPTALSATNVTANSLTANWTSVSGATGYRFDVSLNSSFTTYVAGYQDLDVGNTTSRNVTGLAANTFYYYRVRAYNGNGTSPNSNVITIKTKPH